MVTARLGSVPSLVFLHIPKTGGTSLTQSIRSRFAATCCFTDEGNLSPGLLLREAAALDGGHLFYGHPLHNTLNLMGAARLVTILRRPQEHAISNYLHLRRDPALPLHPDAARLAFPEFLQTHWQCLVFQGISLDVGQSATPIDCREEFFRRLPSIQALLDHCDFVGCLDQADDVLQVLAHAQGWAAPPPLPVLNAAQDFGADGAEVATMAAQYRALWADPHAAPLLAAEEGLYGQARRIAKRQVAALRRARQQALAPVRAQGPWRKLAGWLPGVGASPRAARVVD